MNIKSFNEMYNSLSVSEETANELLEEIVKRIESGIKYQWVYVPLNWDRKDQIKIKSRTLNPTNIIRTNLSVIDSPIFKGKFSFWKFEVYYEHLGSELSMEFKTIKDGYHKQYTNKILLVGSNQTVFLDIDSDFNIVDEDRLINETWESAQEHLR